MAQIDLGPAGVVLVSGALLAGRKPLALTPSEARRLAASLLVAADGARVVTVAFSAEGGAR